MDNLMNEGIQSMAPTVYYLCASTLYLTVTKLSHLDLSSYRRGLSFLTTLIITFDWRLNIRHRERVVCALIDCYYFCCCLSTNYLLSPLTKLTKPYLIFGPLNYILIYLPIQLVIRDYDKKTLIWYTLILFTWVFPCSCRHTP